MLRNQVRPSANPQVVAVGASHAESSAVSASAKYVRIAVTVDTYVAIGASPTATTSSMIIPGGVSEIFKCNPADKVSVLQVSTGGFASITEGMQD